MKNVKSRIFETSLPSTSSFVEQSKRFALSCHDTKVKYHKYLFTSKMISKWDYYTLLSLLSHNEWFYHDITPTFNWSAAIHKHNKIYYLDINSALRSALNIRSHDFEVIFCYFLNIL